MERGKNIKSMRRKKSTKTDPKLIQTLRLSDKALKFSLQLYSRCLNVKKKHGKKFKRLQSNFQRRKIQGVRQILHQKMISDRSNITEEKISELEDITMETNQDKTEKI